MKSTFALFITLLISLSTFAQQGINYKALIKDTNGSVLSTTFMNVQFTIHQTSATGTVVYQEDHNYTTDSNGMLILNIGSDTTPSIGVFNMIDWNADIHFLQTTIAYSGGTINFDATQFMAVPYAIQADKANTLIKLPEPFILGRSTQISSGRFSFSGSYGWQAAQKMCEASYPNDPNVRAFTLDQIAQAIVLGNWDNNNLSNINNVNFWAIAPVAYSDIYSLTPHQNNSFGLNHNVGSANYGTRGQIIINATNIPEEPNGDNPSNTYLRINNRIASGANYPCMCGTYN